MTRHRNGEPGGRNGANGPLAIGASAMLKLTRAQLDALGAPLLRAFEDEMVAHAESFSPKLAAVLGEEALRAAVRAAMARAARHGFTYRGPVRLFVELSFLFGSGLDGDVQYPWARAALAQPDPDTQMDRAEALHAHAAEALDAIHGADREHTAAALVRLRAFASSGPEFAGPDLPGTILAEIRGIHPEKLAFTGEPACRELILAGLGAARERGFGVPREMALIVILMFAFGQECLSDPLYPWIERTLTDERIVGATARARRLERKAVTWLDHVLADRSPGVMS